MTVLLSNENDDTCIRNVLLNTLLITLECTCRLAALRQHNIDDDYFVQLICFKK